MSPFQLRDGGGSRHRLVLLTHSSAPAADDRKAIDLQLFGGGEWDALFYRAKAGLVVGA